MKKTQKKSALVAESKNIHFVVHRFFGELFAVVVVAFKLGRCAMRIKFGSLVSQ